VENGGHLGRHSGLHRSEERGANRAISTGHAGGKNFVPVEEGEKKSSILRREEKEELSVLKKKGGWGFLFRPGRRRVTREGTVPLYLCKRKKGEEILSEGEGEANDVLLWGRRALDRKTDLLRGGELRLRHKNKGVGGILPL